MNPTNNIVKLYNAGKSFLNKGQERSIKAKKNILISAVVKGGSIAVNLILVPLTINYVNPTSYGIWITLSSIIGWFSFFDIGFGHGLRNRLAESIAVKDFVLARKYVSTTYAVLSMIVLAVLALFLLAHRYLDWSKILNAPSEMTNELNLTALVIFVFFCLQFVLKLLTTVFTANQEPSKSSIFDFISSLISLIVIFLLTKTTDGNLINLAYAISLAPVVVLLIGSFWFYKGKYKAFSPSIRLIDFKLTNSLVDLGLKFFIIQISAIVVYSTNNVIISHLFGPEEVTPFNISFKLFSIVTMLFNIFSTPFWSAFTDAYVKDDLIWIKKALNKMLVFWFGSIIASIVILVFSPVIIKFWVGEEINVSIFLSMAVAIYVITFIWQNIYIIFLNGVSKIKLQFIASILVSIVNIPLAIGLGKLIGPAGIPLTGAIIFSIMGIVFFIQTKKILNNTARNIWNK
jgi:O-antigen/teichoic acid export membrane protein